MTTENDRLSYLSVEGLSNRRQELTTINQTSTFGSNFSSEQTSSVRETKSNTLALSRAISLPAATTSAASQQSSDTIRQMKDTTKTLDQNGVCIENSFSGVRARENATLIGDYALYNPQSENDVFGNAMNTKSNQMFYWKKFDRRDYMSQMESYFILADKSERIFDFKEILFDEVGQYAYVIFNRFYDDLHSYMKRKKRLDETEAKHLFRQCVEAVNDCHQSGIIVRDIKLKKFVFTDAALKKIALINPEDCLILDEEAPNDFIKSQQGCPAYISPEVLNTSHAEYSGKLSDSWSLGIVLYTLLLGRYPFHHPTIATMFAKIARAKFQIPPSSGLSLDAKLLLRSLIRPKPSERLLPSEILSHNWLKANDTDLSQLHQNKFRSLNSAYSYLNHLSGSFQMSPISNQYIHKPLGISRSSPAGSLMMGHNPIGNEPNINNNNSITNKFLLPPKTSLGVNSNQNESEDCKVPEFIQTN